MNDRVNALAYYAGDLAAAGAFTTAGSISVNRIAVWDGASWDGLGSGLGGIANALTVYDGDLIVGGQFTTAGGLGAPHIARWDGASWHSLGGGISGNVYAFAVYDDELIVGGDFNDADGVPAHNIARWNGTSWDSLGSGLPGEYVTALEVYGGKLYAGGRFRESGGAPGEYIASWDGSSWNDVDGGLSGDSGTTGIWAFAIYDDNLLAGGQFTQAGPTAAANIASWDGLSWSSLGSVNNRVRCLTTHAGDLIAGGRFTQAGGTTVNYVALWDGTSWGAMDGGLTGDTPSTTYALALESLGGDLFVGGKFNEAGVYASKHMARWTSSCDCSQVDDIPAQETIPRCVWGYPNPFSETTTIRYQMSETASVRLTVHDVTGRRVTTLASGIRDEGAHRVRWDGLDNRGERVAPGVYFVRLESRHVHQTERIVLLR
jgi:hypothetical protein